jgi:hypothetical protein
MHGEDSSNRGEGMVNASVVKGSRLLDCTIIRPTRTSLPVRYVRRMWSKRSEAAVVGIGNKVRHISVSESIFGDNRRSAFVNLGVVDCRARE